MTELKPTTGLEKPPQVGPEHPTVLSPPDVGVFRAFLNCALLRSRETYRTHPKPFIFFATIGAVIFLPILAFVALSLLTIVVVRTLTGLQIGLEDNRPVLAGVSGVVFVASILGAAKACLVSAIFIFQIISTLVQTTVEPPPQPDRVSLIDNVPSHISVSSLGFWSIKTVPWRHLLEAIFVVILAVFILALSIMWALLWSYSGPLYQKFLE